MIDLTESLEKGYVGEYTTICDCGKSHSIFAQAFNEDSEYIEDIYVRCYQCGNFVQFNISVN
jgi:hypothetical protein